MNEFEKWREARRVEEGHSTSAEALMRDAWNAALEWAVWAVSAVTTWERALDSIREGKS